MQIQEQPSAMIQNQKKKMNSKIKLAIMAAAVAGFASTSSRAAIETFKWVGDSVQGGDSLYVSGTLAFNTVSDAISSFSFYAANASGVKYSTPDTSFTGTGSILTTGNEIGDLILNGTSTGGSEGGTTSWFESTYTYPPGHTVNDSAATYNDPSGTLSVYGSWVQYTAVPEPATYGAFAGLGLLLVSFRRQLIGKAA